MVWLAEKTLRLINESIVADGGNAFRMWQGRVLPHIGDAYAQEDGSPRSHLGASGLGTECDRALFYSWRWASAGVDRYGKKGEDPVSAEGRIRRLWNRGHLEEGRFIALLLQAGIEVFQQDAQGKQFRISYFGGHVGGSGDGICVGLPDLPPETPALQEFKTHSDSSFKELVEKGVQRAKPEHYVQMTLYMGGFGLIYALYLAANKNTDELYAEIVQYDGTIDRHFVERGRRTVFATVTPPRMRNASPGFFKCKSCCDHYGLCYGARAAAVNCRTCAQSLPLPEGGWACTRHGHILDKHAQVAGCSDYQLWKELAP